MTTNDAHVHDSPEGWVSDHIQRYVETDGEEGHDWNGVPTLLLTTKGRKSGKLRRTALIYGKVGSSYVVVASKGGAEDHPAWYLNLSENPEVAVQVGPDDFTAIARTADDNEKPELWRTMAEIWPAYDEYQTKTDRPIPVVVLDPLQDGSAS
jgi:deazaflavin-dependent oxidoreductase (nitroreductase family)